MAVGDGMSANNTTSETTRAIGQRGEDEAARFIEQRGLTIPTRNFHCRGGEIDLVCRDGKTLVFVEVRLRGKASHGGAAASITATKQGRIILAAQHYLARHNGFDADCRFDCVLIDGQGIEWIRDAFSAD